MTAEWLAGFLEGEGCFCFQVNKPKPGATYGPVFAVMQKESEILELIRIFLLEQGIIARVSRYNYGINSPNSRTLRISNMDGCKKLYNLIRPHMQHPGKIKQIDRWLVVFNNGTKCNPL